jgi:hypothetical protein
MMGGPGGAAAFGLSAVAVVTLAAQAFGGALHDEGPAADDDLSGGDLV